MEAKPKKRKLATKIRVGLSMAAERAMKADLCDSVCSSPWIDAQFYSIVDQVTTPAGVTTKISVTIHDPSVYPPPADTTPMRVCRCCLRAYPAHYVSTEFAVNGEIFKRWDDAEKQQRRVMRRAVREQLAIDSVRIIKSGPDRILRFSAESGRELVIVESATIHTVGSCFDCYVGNGARIRRNNMGYGSSGSVRDSAVDIDAVK